VLESIVTCLQMLYSSLIGYSSV